MDMDESSESNQLSFEEDDYEAYSFTDDDIQDEKFIGQKKFGDLALSSKVKQYFMNFKNIPPKEFVNLFKFKHIVEQYKSICAKLIQHGETIAQCYDCATDKTCIQCMDCFKNSDHEGHKVVIKNAYGGCCDCGDVQAWKKQGFCKKHTGQAIDITIDPNEEQLFVSEMKQVFFLIFWESIKQNSNNCRDYSRSILKNLRYLNEKGVYYTKLTCKVLESRIPENLMVSNNVNRRSILANILNAKVAKNLNIDQWMELFFSMFQYYPFKKLLLSTYIKNFSMIYCDEDSQLRGSSIACQLLTSHQLVRQYALDYNSAPLGSDIKIQKLKSFQKLFYVLYHDFDYITKLSGDTPQVYFRFQFRNKEGLLKMFQYRKVIKILQDNKKEQPDILQLAKYVKYFKIQFLSIQTITKIAGILQYDKQTLQIAIRILYQEALNQENERKMIIFKPLTRALAIFLFAYFDLNLNNLDYSKNKLNIDKLVKAIEQQPQRFEHSVPKLFKICLQYYLFHAKTLAQPGLNSTLYIYIYLYKIKNRLISSVDILSIKMLSMMHGWPQVKKQPIISPDEYIWENTIQGTKQAKEQQLVSKIQNLQFILSQLNLVTASQSNQLYVAYDINPKCELYSNYIEELLLKILRQQKTSVSLTTANQYQQSFFHQNVDISHNYLKKFCTFDKTKKAFIFNNPNSLNEAESDTLNYSDFRCNLVNRAEFQSPEKTFNLIKYSHSQQLFQNIWSIQTIKKFVIKSVQFTKELSTFATETSTMQKLKPLFIQLMKIIYLKKRVTDKPQQLDNIFEFLRKNQRINLLINPFYQFQLNPSNQIQACINQKPLQRKIGSPLKQDSDKKKSLKQKMQQKKKQIRQKYAKQLATFQNQQKIKLGRQQEVQQSQHTLNCIICKNQDQLDLVYIVNICYKNHEKLLNLGKGVSCLSIQSCYHPIDFGCYQKLLSQVGNRKKPSIKCPFCKFRSNTFFPVLSQSKHSDQAIKKFEGAIFMQKNFQEISIMEQLIKSFYHFSLLAYLDPQRTLHRRLKIYRIILQILKRDSKIYSINEVYKKFMTKTMNLNPYAKDEDEFKKRSGAKLELAMFLDQTQQDIRIQDLSDSQIQYIQNIIHNNQNPSIQEENQTGIFQSLINRIKQKFKTTNEYISQQKKQPTQKYTPIFKETLTRIFKFLQINQQITQEQKPNQDQPQKHQKAEQICIIEQDLCPQVQVCLKRLLQPKTSDQTHQLQLNIYEGVNQNNKLLKFRDLPMNFKPLGKLNKCVHCQEITPCLALCLLCDWRGCAKNCMNSLRRRQNKKDIEQAGSSNHSKVHGQESLFLLMQKCMVARISFDSQFQTIGCIYKDQWGNDFDNKKPWESFFLDEGELNKIKTSFLHGQ